VQAHGLSFAHADRRQAGGHPGRMELLRMGAPLAPHRAEGRAELGGETLAVHHRGVAEPFAQAFAQLDQRGVVVGVAAGDLDEFLLGMGHELRQAHVGQQARPDARYVDVTRQGHDRDVHPRGFARGRRAVVRVGVQSQINVAVVREVLGQVDLLGHEDDAVGREPLAAKRLRMIWRVLASAMAEALIRSLPQGRQEHLGPHPERRVGHLEQLLNEAKMKGEPGLRTTGGNSSQGMSTGAGSTSGRRQAEDFLGVVLVGLAGGSQIASVRCQSMMEVGAPVVIG